MSQGFGIAIAKVKEAEIPGAGYKGGLKIGSAPLCNQYASGKIGHMKRLQATLKSCNY